MVKQTSAKPSTETKLTRLPQAMPFILTIAGLLGIISAFMLTYDKFRFLENPKFLPNCDLNPIISCGSVMNSHEGVIFGFPNSFLGLSAFAVLLTVGVGLWAGAQYKKWFWQAMEAGAFLGIIFMHWLFFQSVYRINALCPYCMVVWVATITTFWYVSIYNFQMNYLSLPGTAGAKITAFAQKHHLDILVLWLVIIAFLILKHFWYYYGKNL